MSLQTFIDIYIHFSRPLHSASVSQSSGNLRGTICSICIDSPDAETLPTGNLKTKTESQFLRRSSASPALPSIFVVVSPPAMRTQGGENGR